MKKKESNVNPECKMTMSVIKADSRGVAKHDWLLSYHTFSFADYHDPNRMGFGVLRVINDDYVKPSKGFDSHSHQNMEIITIPLKGSLSHRDHLGNHSTIRQGEVQIMSAGTGIIHSEHNASPTDEVNLFQIWIYPKQKQIMPRYGQKKFDVSKRKNTFQCVVSPDEREGSLWINQDAWISLANVDPSNTVTYKRDLPDNGIYIMLIEGKAEIGNQTLQRRDAIEITETDSVDIIAKQDTQLVVFEIPMK